MDITCVSALDKKLAAMLVERDLANTRFSTYSCYPNSRISRLYKYHLCSDLFDKELHIKYLMLLYKDSGIEVNLSNSEIDDQDIYQKAIERSLYHSKSDEEFIAKLRKFPHEKIYADYIYMALRKMHELEKFYNTTTPINIDDEVIDEHIDIIDNIYSKPILALKETLRLMEEKDISIMHLICITSNVINAFQYEYIMPSERILSFLENSDKEEFASNINISTSPEKVQDFKEKLKESAKTLSVLREEAERVNKSMFHISLGIKPPLTGLCRTNMENNNPTTFF